MSADEHAIRGAAPDPSLPWPVAYAGVKLVAHFEQGPRGGVALEAYRCEAGVWTLGWGETLGVSPGDTCTKAEADKWLCDDMTSRARLVRELCTVPPGPNELAAMVSLSYNIGFGDPKRGIPGFKTSSVLRLHNAGKPLAAARAFELWNKVRDKVTRKLRESAGLTRRRKAEAAMYLLDTAGSTRSMPQAVEAESKLSESPLVKIGATLAGSGGVVGVTNAPTPAPDVAAPPAVPADAVATVKETAAQVSDVADAVTSASTAVHGALQAVAGFLGVTPGLLLAGLLVAAGAGVIYWRTKQRREGWA